jgi:hypothetical protein
MLSSYIGYAVYDTLACHNGGNQDAISIERQGIPECNSESDTMIGDRPVKGQIVAPPSIPDGTCLLRPPLFPRVRLPSSNVLRVPAFSTAFPPDHRDNCIP